MSKIDTLKKNYEFKNVMNKGKFFVKKQIIVYITPNKRKSNTIGIAVSTKVCNAVKRNFIKRKIRESYREVANSLIGGHNIVFLWNKNVSPEKANFFEIKREMLDVFYEEKMIKD